MTCKTRTDGVEVCVVEMVIYRRPSRSFWSVHACSTCPVAGDPSGVLDGTRGRRRPDRADRAVSGLPDRHRAVPEHRQGLRPRSEGLLRLPGPAWPGLARGTAGRHRGVRGLAAPSTT